MTEPLNEYPQAPPLTIEAVRENMDKFVSGSSGGGRAFGTYEPTIQAQSREAIQLCGQIMLDAVNTADLITLHRMANYTFDLDQSFVGFLLEGSIQENPLFSRLRLGILKRLQSGQPNLENDEELLAFNRLYIFVKSPDRDTYSTGARLKAATRNLLHRNLDHDLGGQLSDIERQGHQKQRVVSFIKERTTEEIERLGNVGPQSQP